VLLALLGAWACWRERKAVLLFCLGSIGIHVLAYSLRYPFEPYDWYWMPALFLLLWLAVIGAGRVGALIGTCVPRPRWLPGLMAAALCALIVAGLTPLERQETRERKQWLNYGEHDRAQAGRWVAAHTPPWFRVETCWGNAAVFSRRYVYDCSFLNRRVEANQQNLREQYRPEIGIYQAGTDVSPAHPPPLPGYQPVRLFTSAFDAGLGNYFFYVYAREDVLNQISDISLAVDCSARGPDACYRYVPPPAGKAP
jgi:hypothetical protein